ncbi:MAG: hypothetical protein Q8Q21_00590 [bacterium]|nr:hypothetical protein [bacterium]
MKTYKQSFLAIVVGLALAAGISSAAGVWNNPTSNPTGGNTDAPINVGSSGQAKAGGLALGTSNASSAPSGGLYVGGATNFYGLTGFNQTATFNISRTIFNAGIKIPTSAGKGKVLTSNSSGEASWDKGISAPSYDSGWMTLSKGYEKTLTHNINGSTNTLNTLVYLEGKDENGKIHNANLGTDVNNAGEQRGFKIYDKTSTTITVKRMNGDKCNETQCWESFRVLIWKIFDN